MGGRMTAGAALAAVLIGLSVACSGADGTQGGAESVCVAMITYQGHTYTGSGLHPDDEGDVGVVAGRRLGTGIVPACDDTPNNRDGAETSSPVAVYAIEGVDPARAVTLEHPAGGTIYIEENSDKTLPELRKLIEAGA